MNDDPSTLELRDEVRTLRDLQRGLSTRLSDVERWFAEAGRRELQFRSELLRLRVLVRALLSPSQREAFDFEFSAGVTMGDALDSVVEAPKLIPDDVTREHNPRLQRAKELAVSLLLKGYSVSDLLAECDAIDADNDDRR